MAYTMTIQDALAQLGVRDDSLKADEKNRLDRDGFLPLPGILSADQIAYCLDEARLLAHVNELIGRLEKLEDHAHVNR